MGPLSFQGEVAWAQVQTTDGSGDPSFYAFYMFTSYFLTGERRPYDVDKGSFAPIVPHNEFMGQAGGAGALELAFRFSRIDLTDKKIDGGIMNNLTGAFNWYASRNARVLTNVIRSRVEGSDPVWIFQVRLQWAY